MGQYTSIEECDSIYDGLMSWDKVEFIKKHIKEALSYSFDELEINKTIEAYKEKGLIDQLLNIIPQEDLMHYLKVNNYLENA